MTELDVFAEEIDKHWIIDVIVVNVVEQR